MAEDITFEEWMINYALWKHLESDERGDAKKWFFSLRVLPKSLPVRTVCGFDWLQTATVFEYETGLRQDRDRGEIGLEGFKSKYWAIRPDFRFWTNNRKRQLIIECKGRSARLGDDSEEGQAQRYFQYLNAFPAEGAVLYLVPSRHSERWLKVLESASTGTKIAWGAICWEEHFLEGIGMQLSLAVAEGVVKHAKLLEKAIGFARVYGKDSSVR